MLAMRQAGPGDLAAIEAMQHAAYAPNRVLLGVEPLPLQADYRAVLRDYDVWLAEAAAGTGLSLAGVLVLRAESGALLIWSIATAPEAQGRGVANRLLQRAETSARALGLASMTLYTGEKLVQNIAWYARHGFVVTRREALPDRVIVHMEKVLVPRVIRTEGRVSLV